MTGTFLERSTWAVRHPIFRKIVTPTAEGWQHHTGIREHGGVPTAPGRDALINWARGFEDAEIKHDPELIAIGYHRLIISGGPHDGARIETRPWGHQGGATLGRNSVSHAICITGNFSAGDIPSTNALDSAAEEWAGGIMLGFVSFNALIDSHSNAPGNSTACCGTNLISKLPELRRRIAAKLSIPQKTPPAPAKPDSSPAPPTIRSGSTGPVVSLWQGFLKIYASQNVAVDGIFGPATLQATINFQRISGLKPVDGIVGPMTWGMMEYVARTKK